MRRQTGSGTPITTGSALTVNLTSSPSSGATFGTTQFASARVTSVTIPSGQSTATFWYGLTTTGRPTVTASATSYVSATQLETITTSPVGIGMALGYRKHRQSSDLLWTAQCELHLQRDGSWDLWNCCLLRHFLEFRQRSGRLQCHPGVDDQRDRS